MRAALALAVVLQASYAFAQTAPVSAAAGQVTGTDAVTGATRGPTSTAISAGSPEAGHPERSDAASAAERSRRAAISTGSPEAGHPERSDAAVPARSPVAPTAAVVEKLAQGDRAFAAGDLRAALFAYQDAVFLQPGYAFARVKLGRAYLALRYPAQAIAQAELALGADPGSEDARRLSEDARAASAAGSGAPAPAPAVAAPSAVGSVAPSVAAAGATAAGIPPGATVVVVMPAGAPATPVAVPPSAPVAPAPPQPRTYRLSPGALEAAPAQGPAAPAPSAAQRYRSALELIARRDFDGAIFLLDEAIAIDPRLAVAYTARASARFGLGRFRDAADDYKAAIGLDPALATPLYGLAECYRLVGDPLAAELYRRYAASHAPDVREDLRTIARDRGQDLTR